MSKGGRAVGDILFGHISPAGKLPITFYYNHSGLPEMTEYSMKGRTYRYLETKPWRPFGYGLTYSSVSILDFSIGCPEGSDSYAAASAPSYTQAGREGLTCSISCKNTGSFPVDEVLQIYIQVTGTSDEVSNGRLAAFKRISLSPGETAHLSLSLPAAAFSVVNEEGVSVFNGTGARLFAGFCSPFLWDDCSGKTLTI